MAKTSEALYADGHLQGLGAPPGAGRQRLRITSSGGNSPRHAPQEGHRLREATPGAWGRGKPLEAIDAERDRVRAEWARDARRPETGCASLTAPS
jgi:hypothetical protein